MHCSQCFTRIRMRCRSHMKIRTTPQLLHSKSSHWPAAPRPLRRTAMNNLFLIGSILLICASTLSAQDKMAIPPPGSPAPKHYYRLNYVLKESDEGKVINQRAYTIPTTAGDEWSRLRAGTRLPVTTGNIMK